MSIPVWMTALGEVLAKHPKAKTYSLATIDKQGIPRVRSVISRAILSTTASLPLLIHTTDMRTSKVTQMTTPDESKPNSEIAWWIEDANEQYRITAHAYILPNPSHPLTSTFPGARLAPTSSSPDAAKFTNWEDERVKVYNSLRGPMRAWFAGPAPGAPLKGYDDVKEFPKDVPAAGEAEQGSEDDKLVHKALENFALVVLEPVFVERVELGTDPHKRTQWERVKGAQEGEWDWKEGIVAP